MACSRLSPPHHLHRRCCCCWLLPTLLPVAAGPPVLASTVALPPLGAVSAGAVAAGWLLILTRLKSLSPFGWPVSLSPPPPPLPTRSTACSVRFPPPAEN